MTRRSNLNIDEQPMSADYVERIIRQARAQRSAALGRSIGYLIHAVARAWRRCAIAVNHGRQMHALASLDDRRLAAMGITRDMVPAVVLGWTIGADVSPAEILRVATNENVERAPDRAAA